MPTTITGRVKHYLDREDHLFGFIAGDDGMEYFFHVKHVISRIPIKGERVRFEVATEDRRGRRPVAKNISIIRPTISAKAEAAFHRICERHGEG